MQPNVARLREQIKNPFDALRNIGALGWLELNDPVKAQFVCFVPEESSRPRIKALRYQHRELVAEIFDESDLAVLDQLLAISWRPLNHEVLLLAPRHPAPHSLPQRHTLNSPLA